ncbi:Hypothetical protein CINCED_3A002070 [Cinara cedri]|uniref:Uncharacterized protein n=1 Tax=Cinara cedri TaxID=506608 RepID=A0A5E4NHU9_9HEMI|nr:Hypothetical protein CINCED_3A002070 [Cinara cedri]
MWLFKSTPVNELCDKTVQFKNSNEEVSNTFINTPILIQKAVKVKQFYNLKEHLESLKQIQTKIGLLHEQTKNKNQTPTIPYVSSNNDNEKDVFERLETFNESIQKISKEVSRLSSMIEEQKCNEKKENEQISKTKSNDHTVTSDCLKLLDNNVVHESNLPPSQSTIIKSNNDEIKTEVQKIPSFNPSKKSQKKKISGSKLKTESNTKFESTSVSENTNTPKIDLNSVNENEKTITENVLACFSNNIESVLNKHFTTQKNEKCEILDYLSKLEKTLKTLISNKSVEHAQNKSNVKIENNKEHDLITENIKFQNECKNNLVCSTQPQKSINEIPIVDPSNNKNVCKNTCNNLNGCNCKLIKNEATNTEITRPSQHIDYVKISLGELLSFLKYKEEEVKSLNVCPMTIENVQKNKLNENNNNSDCPKKINSCSKNGDVDNNGIAVKSTNTMKLNVCKENDICSFLHSQPIPEWITLLKKDVQINVKKEQCQETLNQPEKINNNSQHGQNIDQCKRIINQNPQTANQYQSTNSSQTVNQFQQMTESTDQCPKTSTNHCLNTTPNQYPKTSSNQYVKTTDQYPSMNIDQHQKITNKYPSQKSIKVQQTTELIDQRPKTIDQCIQTSLSQASNKNLQMTTQSQKYANDNDSKEAGQFYIIANNNYKPDTQVWIPIRPK